jgi:uncharacterized protein YprB with RNaseH-like and TPR domain
MRIDSYVSESRDLLRDLVRLDSLDGAGLIEDPERVLLRSEDDSDRLDTDGKRTQRTVRTFIMDGKKQEKGRCAERRRDVLELDEIVKLIHSDLVRTVPDFGRLSKIFGEDGDLRK